MVGAADFARNREGWKCGSERLNSFSHVLGEQVFARAAGTPVRPGNQVRLLVNADENYHRLARFVRVATLFRFDERPPTRRMYAAAR
jgi:hypothetical protein